jgi:two-component sensor histidine kinase
MINNVPYDRLMFFKEQVGLDQKDLDHLHRHSDLFASRKEKFAAYFEEVFGNISQTRPYLEVQDYPGQLQRVWMNWFARLFSSPIDQKFFDGMWKSGQTHVRINLDHRFVNLGYCLARGFCKDIVEKQLPLEERFSVHNAVEKLLDLCLLIETDAFVTSTFQCDSEVIKGIAHQIRNPIMVIGASMMRLMRKEHVSQKTASETYETVLDESRRMEKMVADVSIFNEIFHSTSEWSVSSLHEQLKKAVDKCHRKKDLKHLNLQMGFAGADIQVLGNPREIHLLFNHLLENAIEAVDPDNPVVTIQTSLDPGTPRFALVEIFNTGKLANSDDIEVLFTPFYSTKAAGTGMGLPIARAVVQKIKGKVILQEAEGGVVCFITLPRGDSRK